MVSARFAGRSPSSAVSALSATDVADVVFCCGAGVRPSDLPSALNRLGRGERSSASDLVAARPVRTIQLKSFLSDPGQQQAWGITSDRLQSWKAGEPSSVAAEVKQHIDRRLAAAGSTAVANVVPGAQKIVRPAGVQRQQVERGPDPHYEALRVAMLPSGSIAGGIKLEVTDTEEEDSERRFVTVVGDANVASRNKKTTLMAARAVVLFGVGWKPVAPYVGRFKSDELA